jgi:cell wall-associated NlpC family hydrolase
MAQRDSEGPSRDEVQQRINSLYDRAETATGNFNATRAMSKGSRRRLGSVFGGQRRSSEPSLDNVARQWFDSARAKLGPTVPAVLPADRTPDVPAGGRPTGPAKRAGDGLPGLPELERAMAERPPVRELTAGAAAGPVAELTARPMAALPAAPKPRPETSPELPSAVARPGRSTATVSKEQNQRKLTAARELLAGKTAQRGAPFPALEARPADAAWGTPEAGGDGGPQWQPQRAALAGADVPGMTVGTGLAAPAVPFTSPTPVTGTPAAAPAAAFASLTPLPGTPALGTATGPATPTALEGTPAPDTFTAFAAPLPLPGTPAAAPAASAAVAVPNPAPGAPAAPAPFPGTPAPAASAVLAVPAAPVAPAPGMASFLPAVADAPVGYGTKGAKALEFARAQIGKPCVWGAAGPGSYDASGLTQAAWKAAGVDLPRSVQDQAAMGTPVPLTDLRPGDLVFFHDTVGHVGICAGNGMMIHAPGPGAYIREESLSYAGPSAVHGAVRPA